MLVPLFDSQGSSNTKQRPIEFLVVHGKSSVECLNASGTERTSLIASIQARFGDDVEETKTVNYIRGFQNQSCSGIAVVALCSKQRHEPRKPPTTPIHRILDLHTHEAPIETTDSKLTLDQLNLEDLLVDGILNIYAVERLGWATSFVGGIGKEVLFGLSEAWVRHLYH